MTSFIKPLRLAVGALLLGGAGVLAYMTINDDAGTYTVTAYFDKAIGLFENSDVDILGVPVGKVTTVDPEGSRVRVEMEISNDYKIPAGAIAQIVPPSVISDRYVQFSPVYRGGPTIVEGDVLDVDRTQIPAELDDVFKQLKKLLKVVEPKREGAAGPLGKLIVQLDETLRDREEELRGTLIHTADVTQVLADARKDISALLVNLDDLFGQLVTRANSIGGLNRNFALVMTALAQSRQDLEGALHNLAGLTNEVGDLVKDHRGRLGEDLRIAARITSVVLKHRASVEESLSWLPVVAEGITNAYHPPPFNSIDVYDNARARIKCKMFDDLPEGPVKEALKELCREETGEPEDEPTVEAPPELKIPLNCDKGVKKVRRQIKRLDEVSLPAPVLDEILKPFEKQLRQLKKKCKQLGDGLKERILDKLPDVGDIPEIDHELNDLWPEDPLQGNAASAAGVPVQGSTDGLFERVGAWWSGFRSFLGWSS